jgi:S-adenosylmethionine decarboxylase
LICPNLHRQRCAIEFLTALNLDNFDYAKEVLENFLYDLSGSLGMTIFMGPFVGNDEDEATGETGPSAFIGWTTSGCQVHVWPRSKFISIDVYSCKPYSVSTILDSIDQWLQPTQLEVL